MKQKNVPAGILAVTLVFAFGFFGCDNGSTGGGGGTSPFTGTWSASSGTTITFTGDTNLFRSRT